MQRKDLMKKITIVLKARVAFSAAGDDLVYTDRKECE
jgi:hypothetical protein